MCYTIWSFKVQFSRKIHYNDLHIKTVKHISRQADNGKKRVIHIILSTFENTNKNESFEHRKGGVGKQCREWNLGVIPCQSATHACKDTRHLCITCSAHRLNTFICKSFKRISKLKKKKSFKIFGLFIMSQDLDQIKRVSLKTWG